MIQMNIVYYDSRRCAGVSLAGFVWVWEKIILQSARNVVVIIPLGIKRQILHLVDYILRLICHNVKLVG